MNEWFLHDFNYQIMGWEVCDVDYDHNYLTSLQVKHWSKYTNVKIVNQIMSYHFFKRKFLFLKFQKIHLLQTLNYFSQH
jgi:hypothetical protein